MENLQHLGWQPYTVQSFQSWCGHRQEIIPFPRANGSVLFIDEEFQLLGYVVGWIVLFRHIA